MKPFSPSEFSPIPPISAQAALRFSKADPNYGAILWAVQSLSQTKGALEEFCAFALNHSAGKLLLGDFKGDLDSLVPPQELEKIGEALASDPSAMECEFVRGFSRRRFRDWALGGESNSPARTINLSYLASRDPDPATYREVIEAARTLALSLPNRLSDFATNPQSRGRFLATAWATDLPAILEAGLAAWPAYLRAKGVETTIGEKVREACDFSKDSGGLVLVQGDSRIGKTTAARNWLKSYPHSARYFTVEAGQNDRNFYSSMARQIGCDVGTSISANDAQVLVADLLRAMGAVLIVDEAHHLFSGARNTLPRRLEWLRTALVNQGVPIVLISTPQFSLEMREVEKKSGYNMDQLRGRILRAFALPPDLAPADYIAVAKHLFPEMPEAAVEAAAKYAMTTRLYLHSLRPLRTEVDRQVRDYSPAVAMKRALKACQANDRILYGDRGLFAEPSQRRSLSPVVPHQEVPEPAEDSARSLEPPHDASRMQPVFQPHARTVHTPCPRRQMAPLPGVPG